MLVLDADERLAAGAGQAIAEATGRGGFDLGFLRFHNAVRGDAPPGAVVAGSERMGAPYFLPRLLRRLPDLRFRGIVHENVNDWAAAHGNRFELLPADVVHLGYFKEAAGSLEKRDRNLRLLERRLLLEPDDLTAHGYLAMERQQRGEAAAAEAVAEAGWALVPRQPPHRSLRRLAVVRAMAAVQRGDPGVALETLDVVEAREVPNPDFSLLRGMAEEVAAFGLQDGEGRAEALGRAVEAYRRAAALLAEGRFLQVVLATAPLIQLRLGAALVASGRLADAAAAFRAASRAGGGAEATIGLAEAQARGDGPAAALATLEPHLGEGPEAWLVAALAAARLGATADARLFLARAGERSAGGWASPHHRALHRDLGAALQEAR